jgi:hypothetical protein
MPQLSSKAVESHSMLSLRLAPATARRDTADAAAPLRIEVCPPRPFGEETPLVKRLWRSMAGTRLPEELRAFERLKAVREEFSAALDDIDTRPAHDLQQRLLHCRSMRELWHLRSEIFDLVARHLSQAEAQSRLAALNRHFPTRSPGSGFAPPDF